MRLIRFVPVLALVLCAAACSAPAETVPPDPTAAPTAAPTAEPTAEPTPEVTPEPTPDIQVVDGVTYVNGILIANKSYGLPADYAPGVSEEAQSAFEEMAAGAAEDGINLYIASGFRSYDYQAKLYQRYVDREETICGPFLGRVMEKALKMGESNACMKRIVAAPTAGACGVVPAVLLAMQETAGYSDEDMTQALYVAAGIGGVIASRAFISGAQGGCQAEVGSASSMAAGAAAFLRGADASAIAHGAAMAMKNLLGLVCDPVAGLVEVPCVKRNVAGAVVALAAADMALAGIRSKIPPDEVIDAMRSVGQDMPV